MEALIVTDTCPRAALPDAPFAHKHTTVLSRLTSASSNDPSTMFQYSRSRRRKRAAAALASALTCGVGVPRTAGISIFGSWCRTGEKRVPTVKRGTRRRRGRPQAHERCPAGQSSTSHKSGSMHRKTKTRTSPTTPLCAIESPTCATRTTGNPMKIPPYKGNAEQRQPPHSHPNKSETSRRQIHKHT